MVNRYGSFSSEQSFFLYSSRYCQRAVGRSTPHLPPLLYLPHQHPTQPQHIPLPLLLTAALLFGSPVSLRPTSAPLCFPNPPVPPVSPLLLWGSTTPLIGWIVCRVPFPPCHTAVRCSHWRNSFLLGLALMMPTVR